MPDDRPTAAELVDAVTEFLERDLQPALEGRLGFHTRVAVNALKIVRIAMAEHQHADAVGLRDLCPFLNRIVRMFIDHEQIALAHQPRYRPHIRQTDRWIDEGRLGA